MVHCAAADVVPAGRTGRDCRCRALCFAYCSPVCGQLLYLIHPLLIYVCVSEGFKLTLSLRAFRSFPNVLLEGQKNVWNTSQHNHRKLVLKFYYTPHKSGFQFYVTYFCNCFRHLQCPTWTLACQNPSYFTTLQ